MIYLKSNIEGIVPDDAFLTPPHKTMLAVIVDEYWCNVLDLAGVDPEYASFLTTVFPSRYANLSHDDDRFDDLRPIPYNKVLLERYFSKMAYLSYEYAMVKNARFIAGECAIMKVPRYAFMYAIDIIKGRFIEAEPYLREDPEVYDAYEQFLGRLK